VPGRPAGLRGLGRGTSVVAGTGEQFPHDLGGAGDGLAGELGLDGPAFTGPGQGRPGRPVQFAVRQVIPHAEPAARPDPPLAAPERAGPLICRGGLQGQPDRGHGPDVRQPGRGGRHGGVTQAAGGQPGPGGPDPRRARAEPGRFGQAKVPPPDGDPAGPLNRDPQDDGELVQLHSVHLGGEHQRIDVASRQRPQRLPLSVTIGHRLATIRPLQSAPSDIAVLVGGPR
jgi:hypothetical protein